jgi:hypothetical protein
MSTVPRTKLEDSPKTAITIIVVLAIHVHSGWSSGRSPAGRPRSLAREGRKQTSLRSGRPTKLNRRSNRWGGPGSFRSPQLTARRSPAGSVLGAAGRARTNGRSRGAPAVNAPAQDCSPTSLFFGERSLLADHLPADGQVSTALRWPRRAATFYPEAASPPPDEDGSAFGLH